MNRLIIVSLLALSASGCVIVADVDTDWDWGGNWVERKQDLGDVQRIEFDAPGTLYITQGKTGALRLEGNEQSLESLQIDQREGTLVISQAGEGYQWYEIRGKHQNPIYSLEIDTLAELRHDGRGTVNIGPFTLENVRISSGDYAKTYVASLNARDVEIRAADHANIQVQTLDSDAMALRAEDHSDVYVADANVLDSNLRADDHGEIWLAGRTDSLDARIDGHGDIEDEEFHAAIAEVVATDYARAAIHAADEVTIDESDRARVIVSGAADTPVPGD